MITNDKNKNKNKDNHDDNNSALSAGIDTVFQHGVSSEAATPACIKHASGTV